MPRRPRSAPKPVPEAPTAHGEVFYSLVTGEPIVLRCHCPIGRDHFYGEAQLRDRAATDRAATDRIASDRASDRPRELAAGVR